MLHGKKGVEASLETVASLIIVVAVLLSLTVWVFKITDDSLLEREHHAKDIALTLDIVAAAQGTLNMIYPLNSRKPYEVHFHNGTVSVYEQDKDWDSQVPAESVFSYPPTMTIEEAVISGEIIEITKLNNSINFSEAGNE